MLNRRSFRVLGVLLGLAVLFLALGYRGEIDAATMEALYTDEHSQFVEIDDSRVHFRDHLPASPMAGTPTLLLIHGTASSLHTWDGWVDALGDRFRILRVDLQGFGLTGANASADYSTRKQNRVLKQLLDRQGIDRVAVAGNSLGGLIAWRFANEYPDLVSHLVLIDAAGAHATDHLTQETPSFRVLDLASVPGFRLLLTRWTPRFLVEKGMQQVYGDPSKVTPQLVDRYHQMLRREGNRRALIQTTAARQAPEGDPRPGPDALRLPTLILWGEQDTWIPVGHAHRFHELIPDSELIIYPDVGHVPMEEIPEQTARDTADFLLKSLSTEEQQDEDESPQAPLPDDPDALSGEKAKA